MRRGARLPWLDETRVQTGPARAEHRAAPGHCHSEDVGVERSDRVGDLRDLHRVSVRSTDSLVYTRVKRHATEHLLFRSVWTNIFA